MEKRALRTGFLFLSILLLALAWRELWRRFEIDACFDRGGSWNRGLEICDYPTVNDKAIAPENYE